MKGRFRMSHYSFVQRCRARGDYRVREVIEFLELVKEAFRLSDVYDSRSRPVEVTEAGLRQVFERAARGQAPRLGATVDLFTLPPRRRDDNTVRIEIGTGHYEEGPFIDYYDLSMGDARKVPDFKYFKKSIAIFRPFEAFLEEAANESRLDSYDRQQGTKFSRPVIIRGFHYLDAGMARSIGGIEYCLKAPAWHVRRFCEGVLIELVPNLFDADNLEHVRVQEEAMAYFNLSSVHLRAGCRLFSRFRKPIATRTYPD